MLAARIHTEWDPKPGYEPTPKDVEGERTYIGGQVWKNPQLKLEKIPVPKIDPEEVLIKVKACGICGSDIHMYETRDGYIKYPGLTAFPCTIGHEFSGRIEKVGRKALSASGRRFKEGDAVTSEEMIWCGRCRECRDGFPNHCRNLEEIGFSRDGALAEYIRVPARTCWSVGEILDNYGEGGFEAAALVEPLSVAYNALFERAGGFRPGSTVVIFGAGPVGLGAAMLAKASGAIKVIISEPSPARAKLAKVVGADGLINPKKCEKVHEKILELTSGEGADLYLEAAGAFRSTWPAVEKSVWEGEKINAKISVVGRASGHVPIWFEIPQVRRANIYGVQGHSGHGIFPSVIKLIASKRIDPLRIVTERFPLKKIEKAMKTASERRDEHAKILIKP